MAIILHQAIYCDYYFEVATIKRYVYITQHEFAKSFVRIKALKNYGMMHRS